MFSLSNNSIQNYMVNQFNHQNKQGKVLLQFENCHKNLITTKRFQNSKNLITQNKKQKRRMNGK
jgi:flagellin-specific chaperone FliS